MKRAMLESAREKCGSLRLGGGNPKGVGWNDQEDAWKEVLGTRDENVRERLL